MYIISQSFTMSSVTDSNLLPVFVDTNAKPAFGGLGMLRPFWARGFGGTHNIPRYQLQGKP
jgi:hypothetical protein